ncbi:hypothetical protein BUALT_Bualt04G0140500 [Buddleja alternifolia]|uniref:Uncharacterized protein n=1 Tax=Buddleja alternifolia TaxID=168488 RepID=A0AAV6XQ56_9LAMI|nr:hypothetical protein BUALT_Bualt04G0140500 [Buddleja alternifolia]
MRVGHGAGMGTKIQANAFLRNYHPVIDLDGSTTTALCPLYHENQIAKNGHNPDSFMSKIFKNGYLGYETEKVRQTIIEHESIFRNQLQDLHRLYRRQQELMSEIKRREVKKDGAKEEISKSNSLSYLSNMEKSMQERFSKVPGFDRDAKLSQIALQTSQCNSPDALRFGFHFKNTNNQSYSSIPNPTAANSCSNFNLVTKDFMQDFCSGKKPAEPRKEILSCPLDLGASVSRRKRKIFGVEIFEGNDDTFEATNMSSSKVGKYERSKADLFSNHTDMKGKGLKGCSPTEVNFAKVPYQSAKSDPRFFFKNLDDVNSTPQCGLVHADCQTKQEALPWFLRNSQYSGESSNGTKSSYFMNMDSLQNCSENFFSKQKKETSSINEVNVNDGSAKKILGFPISDMLKDSNSGDERSKVNLSVIKDDSVRKVKTDEDFENKDLLQKGLNNYISDLKHHIDLNLTLDEVDVPLTPSVPTAILKIVTTEIDLESPAVIEPEEDILPNEANSVVSCEESDKIAAEAIIAISLSRENNSVDEPQNDVSIDRLKCLAEIISSQYEDNGKEESIPSGMDYFEFMTLKLEDTKENYHHKSVILHNPSDDEAGSAKLPKRSRSRRGRLRKDFQRDILPGLVTLSRHQVTEDFQAFEELLKGEGSTGQSGLSQRNSMRNGRGRKRSGGTTVKAHCATPKQQQPACEPEERSLTGWGKRTRRLPRQRCPNSFLSFTVKC